MKTNLLLVIFLIISRLLYGQSFELYNKDNQASIGAMEAGDREYISEPIIFTDNDGITREWVHKTYTQGIPQLGNYKVFSVILEKTLNGFVKVDMSGLQVLTHGPSSFAFLNDDNLPDLVQTGRDINNKQYTNVYINNNNESWNKVQEFLGLSDGAIVRIPDPNGDGIIYMGQGANENNQLTLNVKVLQNTGEGNGQLQEIFDGPGGVDGSINFVDIMGGTNKTTYYHGTNIAGSFNKKIVSDENGSLEDVDSGLPTIEDGKSIFFDIDGDGDKDWVCTGTIKSYPGTPRLTLIFENKNGTFVEKQRFDAGYNMKIAVIDILGDGFPDVVVMGSSWANSEQHIAVYSNDGEEFTEWVDHPFHSESTLPQPAWGNGFNNGSLYVTDINNDGKPDIIISGRTTDSMAGWGNYKVQLYINTTKSLSVNDNLNSSDVILYPNPTRGKITLKLPEGIAIDTFVVYDALGRQIGISRNANYFDMKPYTPGMYILRYQTKSGKIGKTKFMKN